MSADSRDRRANLANESDEVLLRLTAKHNDHRAFEVFYQRYRAKILSFLWRHTGNREIAQDLASETFATAYLKASTFDPKLGTGRGWLFGIARIALLASYRQRAVERTARLQLGVVVPTISDEAWEEAEARLEETLSKLVTGLDELSLVERDALIARIVEERDYPEIALSANASEAAIRQRVSRGLRKLRRLLGGETE